MTKLIAVSFLACGALLTGCTMGPVQRGADGTYVSTPAHPAAPASSQTQSSNAN